jgi:hypothetical protein
VLPDASIVEPAARPWLVMDVRFNENDPEATADALVEVLRAAVLLNASVAHDPEEGCFVVTSQARTGHNRTHRVSYDGEVTVEYEDFAEDEDIT